MKDWPTEWLTETPGVRCPSCGAPAGRPILWGMPSDEVFEALETRRIDIDIGGCTVGEDDPTHRCSACGFTFGRHI